VLSRDRLLERVWGYDQAIETRSVDVHVGRPSNHVTVLLVAYFPAGFFSGADIGSEAHALNTLRHSYFQGARARAGVNIQCTCDRFAVQVIHNGMRR